MIDIFYYHLLFLQFIFLYLFCYFAFGAFAVIYCRITKDKKRLKIISKNFWEKLKNL